MPALSANMLAVIIIPAENNQKQQAYGNSGANGRASDTGDDEADECKHAVDCRIG